MSRESKLRRKFGQNLKEQERRDYNAHVDRTLEAMIAKVQWLESYNKMLMEENSAASETRHFLLRQNERQGWEIEELKKELEYAREGQT